MELSGFVEIHELRYAVLITPSYIVIGFEGLYLEISYFRTY